GEAQRAETACHATRTPPLRRASARSRGSAPERADGDEDGPPEDRRRREPALDALHATEDRNRALAEPVTQKAEQYRRQHTTHDVEGHEAYERQAPDAPEDHGRDAGAVDEAREDGLRFPEPGREAFDERRRAPVERAL